MCPKDGVYFLPPALTRVAITFYLHPCRQPPVWPVCFCSCLLSSTFHTTARIILFIFVVIIYSLIGGKLLYSVVLVSAAQQYDSAIITRMSPPSPPHIPPFWVITDRQAGLPVLYSNFSPAIYLAHGSVYILMLLSP